MTAQEEPANDDKPVHLPLHLLCHAGPETLSILSGLLPAIRHVKAVRRNSSGELENELKNDAY